MKHNVLIDSDICTFDELHIPPLVNLQSCDRVSSANSLDQVNCMLSFMTALFRMEPLISIRRDCCDGWTERYYKLAVRTEDQCFDTRKAESSFFESALKSMGLRFRNDEDELGEFLQLLQDFRKEGCKLLGWCSSRVVDVEFECPELVSEYCLYWRILITLNILHDIRAFLQSLDHLQTFCPFPSDDHLLEKRRS